MFDITKFSPMPTSFLHLKSPITEQPLFENGSAVGITVHSPGSAAYEAASTARTDRALIRAKKKTEVTAAALVADQVEFLAAITVSLDNLQYPPAGDATGPALFKALYSDRKFAWLTDQLTAFVGDWENFFEKSAAN